MSGAEPPGKTPGGTPEAGSWQPLLDDPPEVETYEPGSWGPTPPWERQGTA